MHDPLRISLKETSPAPAEVPTRMRGVRHGRLIAVALSTLLLLGLLVWGGVRIYGALTAPSTASAPDTQATVAAVGKLMLLPDETPTIALVSDLSKLKGQAFFAHASLGDIVLMYPKAGRAILYSPTQNKIIEVAPISTQ